MNATTIDRKKTHLSSYWIETLRNELAKQPQDKRLASTEAEKLVKDCYKDFRFTEISALLFAVEVCSQ